MEGLQQAARLRFVHYGLLEEPWGASWGLRGICSVGWPLRKEQSSRHHAKPPWTQQPEPKTLKTTDATSKDYRLDKSPVQPGGRLRSLPNVGPPRAIVAAFRRLTTSNRSANLWNSRCGFREVGVECFGVLAHQSLFRFVELFCRRAMTYQRASPEPSLPNLHLLIPAAYCMQLAGFMPGRELFMLTTFARALNSTGFFP